MTVATQTLFHRRTAEAVMYRQPPIADQDTSLWGAWGRLRGAGCRHLVVVDEQVRPLGVLEERDLALHWPPGPFEAQLVRLREVVGGRRSPRVRSDDDFPGVARVMLSAGTDAVAVVDDDDRFAGLVTARHCVELVATRQVV